jgi:RND family efflux transporter MFP subunit
MSQRIRRRLLPILILGLGVAVAAGLIATRPEPAPVQVAERAWPVSVEPVQAGRYSPTLVLYGRIESRWSTRLTAGIDADVVEVAVVEGESVVQGQLLVRLDDRDARLQLAQRDAELVQAEARVRSEITRHQANLESLPREQSLLALARTEVSRLQDLVASRAGAQSQLDTARQAAERQAIALAARRQLVDEHESRLAEVEAARARAEALRDQARLEVERSLVLAPFDGRISAVEVAPGRRVRPGDPLLRLFATEALLVRAQVPSRHLATVRAALDAGVELVARGEIDGRPVQARLRGLAGEAAAATGGVDALFDVIGGDVQLSEGRFVALRLALPARDGVVSLPHEAVYGTDRIYVVDDAGRMRSRSVRRVGEWFGPDGESRVLVEAPSLAIGERVVTTQLPNAIDGLLVQVSEAAGAAAP